MHHRSEQAAVSVEYALLVFLIAATIAAAVLTFGLANQESFEDTCSKISTTVGSDCTP